MQVVQDLTANSSKISKTHSTCNPYQKLVITSENQAREVIFSHHILMISLMTFVNNIM